MSKYAKKLIYFNKNNEDLYEKIKNINDFSNYVCDLIRADITGNTSPIENECLNEIKQILNQINSKLDNVSIQKENNVEEIKSNDSANEEDYLDMLKMN